MHPGRLGKAPTAISWKSASSPTTGVQGAPADPLVAPATYGPSRCPRSRTPPGASSSVGLAAAPEKSASGGAPWEVDAPPLRRATVRVRTQSAGRHAQVARRTGRGPPPGPQGRAEERPRRGTGGGGDAQGLTKQCNVGYARAARGRAFREEDAPTGVSGRSSAGVLGRPPHVVAEAGPLVVAVRCAVRIHDHHLPGAGAQVTEARARRGAHDAALDGDSGLPGTSVITGHLPRFQGRQPRTVSQANGEGGRAPEERAGIRTGPEALRR
jgi:hypothetical protein